jgi:hypothetical protein
MQPQFPNNEQPVEDAWDAVPSVSVPLQNNSAWIPPQQARPGQNTNNFAALNAPFPGQVEGFGNMNPAQNQGINNMSNMQGTIGGLLGNPLLRNAGIHFGEQLVGKNFNAVSSWWSDRLKYYFNVNNSYVINKLRLLLFPWRQRKWDREPADVDMNDVAAHGHSRMRSANPHPFKPPCRDLMAPDLYIPCMALITYVLLMGYSLLPLDDSTLSTWHQQRVLPWLVSSWNWR